MNRCFLLLLPLLAMLLFTPAAAQLPAGVARPGNHIAARLVAESDRPAAGSTVTLALAMRPEPGWHGYWKNPGDAGTEPRIQWSLPAGVTAGPLRYPVPGRLRIAGLMNYVYEGPYALLVDLEVPRGMAPGTRIPVRAVLDHLACTDEICVPEQARMATELVVGASAGAAPPRRAQFDQWRSRLPKRLAVEGRFELEGGQLRLMVPLPASLRLRDVYFFPAAQRVADHAAPQRIRRAGDRLWVETRAAARAQAGDRLAGVLAFGPGDGVEIEARRGGVPALAAGAVTIGEDAPAGGLRAGAGAILAAFAGAVLGGLLLNVMPCVFPILSLKALGLVRSGGADNPPGETRARREALLYAAGAILVCLALGAAILLLRSGGAAVGWAFQLQDPRVILFLFLLVTAIGLNLAGLFELPALGIGERLAAGSGGSGAFWTGALAAFVATPCTGPFMGAALGAALVLPGAAALAVFGGLGFGLALPFLLLGFVPSLRRRLPRPGPWMQTFRRILSVPMLLTAVALAWVLGRQAGVDAMALGLAAALVLALALWWLGRRQGKRNLWLPLAPAALASIAAIAFVPTAPAAGEGKIAAAGDELLAAEPFSEARLAALVAERRPVFVYFTADWCITCKVNEQGVLRRASVAEAFAAGGVQVLKGDWTRGDPEIGRFLEGHGRSGVPLYLYYAPGQPVRILPQILTVGELTALAA